MPQPPPPNIDLVEVEQWVLQGGTDREIADRLGIERRELRRQCGKLLRQWRARRRLSLRDLQWKEAEAGSIQMLIMLGKDELGQGQKKAAKEERIFIRRRLVDRSGGRQPKATEEK